MPADVSSLWVPARRLSNRLRPELGHDLWTSGSFEKQSVPLAVRRLQGLLHRVSAHDQVLATSGALT
jgi:hypothetical protein